MRRNLDVFYGDVAGPTAPQVSSATRIKAQTLDRALSAVRPRRIELSSTDRPMRSEFRSQKMGRGYFNDALDSIQSFQHESDALLPMVQLRRQIAGERESEGELKAAVAAALDDAELRNVLLAEQRRVVDVALLQLGANNVAGRFLSQTESLVAQERYRLRVQIGDRASVSLVTGDVPPIDFLLPPPERGRSHVLHVALYTADFDLASPVLQRLELPEIGASPPIYFDVAPKSGIGTARARIAVYYDLPPEEPNAELRNHLMQTFALTAAVRASNSAASDGSGICVELEFSLNGRFDEFATLQPRLISLALNDGSEPKSHTLAVKRGEIGLPLFFTEAMIEDSLKTIREVLEWASLDDAQKGPRFPEDKGSEPDFDAAIWRLAKAGRALREEVFTTVLQTPLEAALRLAATTTDQIIQAVHLALNFPFPWTILYDFKLPEAIAEAPAPEICRGFRRQKKDGAFYSCSECLAQCLFPDKRKAVCVYGFWGTRHQVEQLLRTQLDKPQGLQPMGIGAVAYSVGISGVYLDKIPEELTAKLADSAQPIEDEGNLLPMMWSDRRPAVLLLVGHYTTKTVKGEPEGARLTLPHSRFLTPGAVLDQRESNPKTWKDPRSVVLLAACSGGVVDIKGAKNFVSAFAGAGAGAVVGPETIIFEGLARRFAVDMCEALVNGRSSVGAAMLEFRRRLLRDFNPLGLVFTSYGFADLAAPAKGAAPATEIAAAAASELQGA